MRVLSFVEQEAVEAVSNDEPVLEVAEWEYHLAVDEGELLVVQCILQSEHEEEGPWLRHNIFDTKDATKGEVYNIIIDGGSCEYILAAQVVE